MLTTDQLRAFLDERPAISASAFSVHAGFSDKHVRQLLAGDRRLTDEAAAKLVPVMQLYGYQLLPS